MQGKPSPLLSSFKLSYYTLLNLLRRIEGTQHDMEFVIANSFQQFQFERSLPEVGRSFRALDLFIILLSATNLLNALLCRNYCMRREQVYVRCIEGVDKVNTGGCGQG